MRTFSPVLSPIPESPSSSYQIGEFDGFDSWSDRGRTTITIDSQAASNRDAVIPRRQVEQPSCFALACEGLSPEMLASLCVWAVVCGAAAGAAVGALGQTFVKQGHSWFGHENLGNTATKDEINEQYFHATSNDKGEFTDPMYDRSARGGCVIGAAAGLGLILMAKLYLVVQQRQRNNPALQERARPMLENPQDAHVNIEIVDMHPDEPQADGQPVRAPVTGWQQRFWNSSAFSMVRRDASIAAGVMLAGAGMGAFGALAGALGNAMQTVPQVGLGTLSFDAMCAHGAEGGAALGAIVGGAIIAIKNVPALLEWASCMHTRVAGSEVNRT